MNKQYNFWREISYLHNAVKRNQKRARELYETIKLQGLIPAEQFYKIEGLLKRINNILDNYCSNRAEFIFGKYGASEKN